MAILVVEKTTAGREYKVKDLSKADFGRLKIEVAEVEMPGLMACRTELKHWQPLKGARITGSLHMTIQTAVLIETLTALGAEVRWCSCNMFSTQDYAAAAIARDSASVFAWMGETVEEYWWCIERALDWGPGGGPDLIVDDCGDVILFIHEGVKAEIEFEKTGKFSDTTPTKNGLFKTMLTIIHDGLKTDPKKYHKMNERLLGMSKKTTTGVKRLYQMQSNLTLLFPAINANDSFTKKKDDTKFRRLAGRLDFVSQDYLIDYLYSFPDYLKRVTDVIIAGKVALICGFGDTGKGCADAMKHAGVHVMVAEIDPIRALQAVMEGYQVVTLAEVVSEADIFITTTGNKVVIMLSDMKKMKNDAIVCNIGYFDSNDMEGLTTCPGVKRININSQADRWVFPENNTGIIILAEGILMELDCATGNLNFLMSRSFSKQVKALLKLWKEKDTWRKYEKKMVYVLPKHLDKNVVALHLAELGARLTELSPDQAT